jgi:hypothetical protein
MKDLSVKDMIVGISCFVMWSVIWVVFDDLLPDECLFPISYSMNPYSAAAFYIPIAMALDIPNPFLAWFTVREFKFAVIHLFGFVLR